MDLDSRNGVDLSPITCQPIGDSNLNLLLLSILQLYRLSYDPTFTIMNVNIGSHLVAATSDLAISRYPLPLNPPTLEEVKHILEQRA